jgi:LytS/YehU family sensor histidine kinase
VQLQLTLYIADMKFVRELFKAVKFILILCVITIAIQIVLDSGFYFENAKDWVTSNFYFGLPFYFANTYLNNGLNKIYSWVEYPKKRALIGVPAFMIMNVGLVCILIYVFAYFVLGYEDPKIFDRKNTFAIIVALTISIIATLFFHALGFFRGYITQLELSKKLEKEKISAELNALKAQVNPHFLFNSFNVLSGLIDEDPDQAQDFLSGLSKIYRYILENRNEDLCNVSDELSFAQQYFKLQKIRFENSIHMDVDVPKDVMDRRVPSLSLQLLLENAIKHNTFSEENPLRISIKYINNALVVHNNKKSRTNLEGSNGIGLANIDQRYSLHKVDSFSVQNLSDSFTVNLPLI